MRCQSRFQETQSPSYAGEPRPKKSSYRHFHPPERTGRAKPLAASPFATWLPAQSRLDDPPEIVKHDIYPGLLPFAANPRNQWIVLLIERDNCIRSEIFQRLQHFSIPAHRDNTLSTQMLGKLHCKLPGYTCCAKNQEIFSGDKRRPPSKRHPRRHAEVRNSGYGHSVQTLRHWDADSASRQSTLRETCRMDLAKYRNRSACH